jgi:internalin A
MFMILAINMLPVVAFAAPVDITAQITDINLLQAVRDKLIKPSGPITDSDMLTITDLNAYERGITSLAGLEYAHNLQELFANGNSISDLTPLAGLTSMKRLYLWNNNISNIAPLAGLTGLMNLDLNRNDISDISALSGMTNLTALSLYQNNITNISALSSLAALAELHLDDNAGITDYTPLAGLTGLHTLSLSNNGISSISVLTSLTGLKWINLAGNNISNISPLHSMTAMQRLALNNNQIQDISALSMMTQLWELILGTNQVQDISPLEDLTNLTWLDLFHNNISDISPLAGLTNLERLYINENAIQNISPLGSLTHLAGLSIRNNNISDISVLGPLVQSTNLTFLYLRNNYLNLTEGSDTKDIINAILLKVPDAARWNEQNALSGTPFHAQAAALNASSIALSWDHIPDTAYEVSRLSGAGPSVDIALPGNTDTSYTDIGLASGTDYTYTIKARIWQGNGIDPVILQKSVTVSLAPIPVTGITVSGTGGVTTITAAGGTLQMLAAVAPADATEPSVTWSITGGTDLATISTDGLITAIQNGTVTVRATANDSSGVYGEAAVLIAIPPSSVPVTGITVSGTGGVSTITAASGTLQMLAAVTPADASDPSVTWSITGGADFAQISKGGLMTAVKNGTVTVRATAIDGSGIYGETIITIAVPVVHPVVSGAGGTYHQQGLEGLTFTIDSDFNNFQGLMMDGNMVDPDDYDARPGSTIITLHDDYLDTLPIGEHQIRALFTDGYAQAPFTVAQELDPNMPVTGDNDALELFGAIGVLATMALAVQAAFRRKRALR